MIVADFPTGNRIKQMRCKTIVELQLETFDVVALVRSQWSFFLNVSLNSANSVTQIFVITVKGLEPATTCVRNLGATTAPERHM